MFITARIDSIFRFLQPQCAHMNLICLQPLFKTLLFTVIVHIQIWLTFLERQERIRTLKREKFGRRRDQVANLLEHLLYKDLPGYEGWCRKKVHRFEPGGKLTALPDSWWPISPNLTGPRSMEESHQWSLPTAKMQQRRLQRPERCAKVFESTNWYRGQQWKRLHDQWFPNRVWYRWISRRYQFVWRCGQARWR